MLVHAIHLFFGALLFGAMTFDALYLRAPASFVVQPEELIARWRKRLGLLEMFLFLIVFAMGLTMWLPLRAAYPAYIFHTKLLLAIVFLLMGKMRMLKERRKGVQIGLTRVMALLLLVIFSLGIVGGFK